MRYVQGMRTTVTIDDDVLERARAIAQLEDRSLGQVLSSLARKSLEQTATRARERNGFLLLPDRGGPPVTLELVNRLRDETP